MGAAAHAEGHNTVANANYTHTEGCGTVAIGECQHVQGKYNKEDEYYEYAHIVGNGYLDDDKGPQ